VARSSIVARMTKIQIAIRTRTPTLIHRLAMNRRSRRAMETVGTNKTARVGRGLRASHVLKSGKVTAEECLRYSLSLPVSVVITGCERKEVLDQAIGVASSFKPLTQEERQELLARTREAAASGKFEPFKTTSAFDSTAPNPSWLG
jgi:hypothetical protein